MKTKISTLFVGICCSASVLMTGCIDETFPNSVATEDQLTASKKATEALLWAMPAYLNKVEIVASGAGYDWGYGSVMHVRDVMTEDMSILSHSYDWFNRWSTNQYLGESFIYGQFIWNFSWKALQTTNKMIAALDPETSDEVLSGYLGAGYAFRAHLYLDMARMYEFLPNDVTSSVNASGNNVEGLTVPIVTEKMTETEVRNNPRANRAKMAEFILSDLNNAEKHITNLKITSKSLPHLDVVYGLKARYYMWLEDYTKAKEYARKAIAASALTPMNEDQCLSTTKGFNDISRWMWGSEMVAESEAVKTGILNWASWMSNETTFGYTSAGPTLMVASGFYKRMSNTDFRKKLWKAPDGSALVGQTPFLNKDFEENLPAYASVKFRPADGNADDYTSGAATAYPLMRVEEMYFIEAEAAAHLSEGEGRTLLASFMTNYRDPQYTTAATGTALIDEIVFQKRVELWGEGQAYFDVKRLNMSVTRAYSGTNFSAARRFNTNGRPGWMNICIVQSEKNNNKALVGFENPDPSGLYTAK